MEIERKFLIDSIPDGILNEKKAEIEQCYLDFGDGDEPERRIRRLEDDEGVVYFYTEKGKGDLCREEEEYEISEYSYIRLRETAVSQMISKTRYYLPLGELVVEVDVYGGIHAGLIVAEVEFPDLKSAESFCPPNWFGREVTSLPEYRNKNLARTLSD